MKFRVQLRSGHIATLAGFVLLVLLVPSGIRAQETAIFLDGSAVPPLYQGYDSKTGQLKTAVCVEPEPGKPPQRRIGFSSGQLATPVAAPAVGTPQLVSYSVDHIQDSQSLQSTLSLSASASFNIGYGSGSASYDYFSQSNFSSYGEYLSVEVNVENQTETHPNVVYKQPYQKLIDKKKFVEFYSTCGDSFIDGKITGGYFLAIAKFDTRSSSEQTNTSATLQATVGLYGSASATMSSNLQKLTSYSNASVKILRKAPNAAVDDSIAGIISYAQAFPNSVAGDNAYVTKIVLSEYPGDPVASIPASQATTINRLSRIIGKAYQRKADLKYANDHQDQFPQISPQEMSANQDQVDALIDTLKVAGRSCETDITKCTIARYPSVPSLPVRAEWVNLTDAYAKACPEKELTETTRDSDMSIEMRGYWTAWDDKHQWIGVNQTTLYFQDHDGAKQPIKINPSPNVLYKVPAYSVVKLMVGDGPTCAAFTDNHVKDDDPLAWRMFDEQPIARVSFGSLSNAKHNAAAKQSPSGEQKKVTP